MEDIDEERSLTFARAERGATTAGARVTSRLLACDQLEQWITRSGRMPSTVSHGSRERSLAHWVRRQRCDADALCLYQRDRLRSIDAFTFDPRTVRWERFLYAVADFGYVEKRRPSHHPLDESERALGLGLGARRPPNSIHTGDGLSHGRWVSRLAPRSVSPLDRGGSRHDPVNSGPAECRVNAPRTYLRTEERVNNGHDRARRV